MKQGKNRYHLLTMRFTRFSAPGYVLSHLVNSHLGSYISSGTCSDLWDALDFMNQWEPASKTCALFPKTAVGGRKSDPR